MNPKPVAHIYVRHSTKAQAAGDSHGRQMAKAKAWAEENEHCLKEIYDCGISGFTGANRTIGQFGAFIERLRAGELGSSPVLLVESFDRLSREDLNRAQVMFLELLSLGATVVTLANGKRYQGNLLLGEAIMALCEMDAAHAYSARLSDRVSSSVARRKKDGVILHNAGSCPPWLTIGEDRKSWVVLTVEAAKVVRIFELAAAGHGPTAIANQLTGEKVPHFKKTAGWSANLVQRLLLDRRVLGDFQRKGTTEWLVGFFPPVVSPALFGRVNEGRVVRTRGAGKEAEYNLLRGLCFDASGNSLIHRTSGSRGRHWEYLVGRGVNRFRARYDRVEATVLYALQCFNEDIARIQVRRNNEVTGRIIASMERLAVIDRQLSKLTKFFMETDEPPVTLLAEMKDLESDRAKVRTTLKALELAASAHSEPLEELSDGLGPDLSDPALRRAVRAKIAFNFEKIVVHADSLDIYPSGLENGEKFTMPLVAVEDGRKQRVSD